jgi:hypothetical protein
MPVVTSTPHGPQGGDRYRERITAQRWWDTFVS